MQETPDSIPGSGLYQGNKEITESRKKDRDADTEVALR